MKTKAILASTLVTLGVLSSCVKHEIIPAPVPKVDLTCHFEGVVSGTDIEFTQNVSGYFLETDKSKLVVPGSPSEAIYYSEMKSGEMLQAIKINLGTVYWDAMVAADPTLALFNGFMSAQVSTPPVYTIGGKDGFEVSYRDASGIIWLTKDNDPGDVVTFANVVQESDATGDYSKFVASFECTVYHTFMTVIQGPTPAQNDTTYDEQSFLIKDAVFKGWFKR